MSSVLNRVRSMTAQELAHRLHERWKLETDRFRFHCGIGTKDDSEFDALLERQTSSFKKYLCDGPARRFYPSVQDRLRTCSFVELHFPEWLDTSITSAVRLMRHELDILGNTNVNLGANIDWHRDPVSRYVWPQRYWADYDLVHSSVVDPKMIHELNRHQHLPRLAKCFFLTGDERFAREAIVQIESWIHQNPKWNGINWQSSLEIALRSISWIWTLFLLLPSKSFDEKNARHICRSLFAQLDHVYRYPSTYTSPNTHLIGEATALFIAGVLFPEFPRARMWRQFGSTVLVQEMERQVSMGGVYCELSSYYHCYAADFFLQAMVLAKRNGIAFPEWAWSRLNQMFEFILHLTRPDGSIPFLGDDDGGRALALATEDYSTFRDGLCSAAIVFGRGDFKHQGEEFREESLWLLGEDSWTTYAALAARTPAQLHRFYAESGYFFQRSGWGNADSHMVFDCGNLGMPSGGHGHADALTVTLFGNGRELLVDSGTSVYNCAPQWRRFFRSTSAHNTVVVDGAAQSEMSGTFAWSRKATARLRQQLVLPGIEYLDGDHDGYASSHGVMHRRRLVYVRPNYWIILDELSGSGSHDYDFLYHFAPEAELFVFDDERRGEVDCRVRIKDAGLQMFLYASGPLTAEAVCGQIQPLQGWSSRRYGERFPSPVLRAAMRGDGSTSVMSFIVPGSEQKHSRRLEVGGGAVAAVVRDGKHDDVAVLSGGEMKLQVMDCTILGEFFWMRMQNGALEQVLAVNARSFSYCGETIFDNAQASPYVFMHFWENGMVIERGEQEGKVYVRDLRDRQFQRN